MAPMDRAAERKLLARCRRGDEQAWNTLFDLHYAAAGRFIFQLSADLTREDVEEICQEAFLSVVRNLGKFSGRSRLQTWIFRIAANKSRDLLERRRAAKRGGGQVAVSLDTDDEDPAGSLQLPGEAPSPADNLIREEEMAQVRVALDRLGDPCREIIEFRYFGELSYDEIGKVLEMKVKTVSSRLSKCLDRLEAVYRDLLRADSPEKTSPFSV
jgi:RNA polymerase sigma-70 factor (ECF subfamily)